MRKLLSATILWNEMSAWSAERFSGVTIPVSVGYKEDDLYEVKREFITIYSHEIDIANVVFAMVNLQNEIYDKCLSYIDKTPKGQEYLTANEYNKFKR